MSAKRRKNATRNNATLNSYFSSFRMASFSYFVFSPGVISSFRYFAWRFFVISSFRLALFRLFAPSERQAERRINATRKDEITNRRQAKRRNNEKTPGEKTKDAMRKDEIITKRRQAKRRNLEGQTRYHPIVGTELIGRHNIYALL